MSQVKNFKYLGLTATICFKQILVHTVNIVTNLNKLLEGWWTKH